jgi:hypothetical protein
MLKENDPVVIYETGEVGYVEKILDGEGDRLMVRIPHLVVGLTRTTFMWVGKRFAKQRANLHPKNPYFKESENGNKERNQHRNFCNRAEA